MFFVKVFLVVATICCTTQAYQLSNIPIIGGVLGTVSNASQKVVNTAIDAIEVTGEQIMAGLGLEELITKRIQKVLEDLKKLMLDQIPLLGLPRLEPYEHGHQDINIKHEIGIFEGTMDDVIITGLSTFQVEKVAVKKISNTPPFMFFDPNITIDLHYETLNISGVYDIKAYIEDLFNIWGQGKFDLTMRDLNVNINMVVIVEMMKKQIRVDDVSVDIKLYNMMCHFENLMGGGDLGGILNKLLGEIAPENIEMLWKDVRAAVEAEIKKAVNLKIDELGYDTVVGILNNGLTES